MMHFLSRPYWRPVRLLFTACVSSVFLTAAGTPLQADGRLDTRERFVELDSEIQAIKQEILGINREILLLEESSLYPHGEQLVVLVSIANGSTVYPERITLHLDGQTVTQHDYSGSEGAALQAGGVQRLYTGRLTEGEHRLDVSLSGRLARNKAFQQQRSVTLTKMPGRKYMELQLGPGEEKSQPGVTVREWQQ
jgi:hypothetical protein